MAEKIGAFEGEDGRPYPYKQAWRLGSVICVRGHVRPSRGRKGNIRDKGVLTGPLQSNVFVGGTLSTFIFKTRTESL